MIPTEVREVRLEMVWIALEVNNGRLTAWLTWMRVAHNQALEKKPREGLNLDSYRRQRSET